MRHVTTPETQEAALEALRLGCGMLRTQLDAIENVYVTGGSCPPAWADGEALVEGEA